MNIDFDMGINGIWYYVFGDIKDPILIKSKSGEEFFIKEGEFGLEIKKIEV